MISRNAVLTVAVLLISVPLAWLFAGCSFPTFGLPPESQGIACTDVAQCDDMNACTDESCTDGHCAFTNRPEMSDALTQTAGDCHKITCVGGKEEPVLDPT